MGAQINIGDNWKNVSNIKINIGDTWKSVSNAWINIGDNWKVWWQSYSGVTIPEAGKTLGYFKFDQNTLNSYGVLGAIVSGTSNSYTTGYENQALSMQYNANGALYKAVVTFATTLLFPGASGIQGNSGITMGGWFKPNTETGDNQGIMYIGSSNTPGGFGIYMPNGADKKLFMLYGGGLASQYCNITLTAGTWSHIVYILDNTMIGSVYPTKIYLNGQLVYTFSTRNPKQPNCSSYGLQVACMSNNGSINNQQFSGLVDNFFINVGNVWTDTQVLEYYNHIKK